MTEPRPGTEMQRGCVRFRVRGHVQGVGFRWWTQREAERLHLDGSVRNLADGSVEVVAAGPPHQVDRLAQRLSTGPPGARVESVHATPHTASPAPGFSIAHD